MTGKMPKEGINPAQFPETLAHVWQWFLDLNASRQPGFSGASAITYPDLQAYFSLHQVTPQSWEIDVIKRLDFLVMKAQ